MHVRFLLRCVVATRGPSQLRKGIVSLQMIKSGLRSGRESGPPPPSSWVNRLGCILHLLCVLLSRLGILVFFLLAEHQHHIFERGGSIEFQCEIILFFPWLLLWYVQTMNSGKVSLIFHFANFHWFSLIFIGIDN